MPISAANTMKLIVILVLAIGLVEPISGSKKKDDEVSSELADSVGRFNGKLMQTLIKQDPERNILVSPLSIHLALAMILAGADMGSETRKELFDAMSYGMNEEGTYQAYIEDCYKLFKQVEKLKGEASEEHANKTRLDLFTRMITKKGVKPKQSYVDHIKRNFRSKLSSVFDSESKQKVVDEINKWGESVGFNSPLIEKEFFDEEFSAVLITAINLEAFWLEGLKESPGKFYDFGNRAKEGDVTKLRGLHIKSAQYIDFVEPDDGEPTCLVVFKEQTFKKWVARLAHLQFHALKLKLKDDFDFYVFLPANPKVYPVSGGGRPQESKSSESRPGVDGVYMKALAKLAKDLFGGADFCGNCTEAGTESCGDSVETNLHAVIHLLNMHHNSRMPDDVILPKMKFESELDMMGTLKLLGVTKALSSKSEIGNMTEGCLEISEFKHKTMIEATEKGIRAAGFTVAKLVSRSASRKIFDADRPFLFAIYYKQIPLFFGQYVEHSSGGQSPKKDE